MNKEPSKCNFSYFFSFCLSLCLYFSLYLSLPLFICYYLLLSLVISHYLRLSFSIALFLSLLLSVSFYHFSKSLCYIFLRSQKEVKPKFILSNRSHKDPWHSNRCMMWVLLKPQKEKTFILYSRKFCLFNSSSM